MPLELRKDIERIHRNLGHASADQLEKLFRDANVSDDAISALKHFRCDACDRFKQPPSKRKVAVNHAETFNDIVSMDVNFWKITIKESRVKTTLKVLNIVDAASGMHIVIQIADQTAETIWRAFATGWLRWAGSPRCLRVDPHRSQVAREFFDKTEGRGLLVEPTPAEAHWLKTMPGTCDKWNTELLRTLMCRKVISRQCLTSRWMQRTVWCNTMDTCQDSGCSVWFLGCQVTCLRKTLIYPIWILRAPQLSNGGH